MILHYLLLYSEYNLTSENLKNITTPIFVLGFAPWCGHCKRTLPEWLNFSRLYQNDSSITIGLMNCVQESELCRSLGVSGYPSFFLILDDNPVKVSPRRTVEGFQQILEKLEQVEKFNLSEKGKNYPYFEISYPNESVRTMLKAAFLGRTLEKDLYVGVNYTDQELVTVYFNETESTIVEGPIKPKLLSNLFDEFLRDDFAIFSPSFFKTILRKLVLYFPSKDLELNISLLADEYRNSIYFSSPASLPDVFVNEKLEINATDFPALVSIVPPNAFYLAKRVQNLELAEEFLVDLLDDKLEQHIIKQDEKKETKEGGILSALNLVRVFKSLPPRSKKFLAKILGGTVAGTVVICGLVIFFQKRNQKRKATEEKEKAD